MFYIPQNSFEIKETQKKGRGVFVLKHIKSGTIIGEYEGKHLPYHEIDPQDFPYLMYFNDQKGIVAQKNEIGVHLINHSCNPNCTMEITKEAIKFVAIRDITPSEELTISYNYPSQDNCADCTHKCFCGSKNCLGTMHPLINKA